MAQKALCKGEHPFPLRLSCGKTVAACFASQVRQIRLCYENDKIVPREFSLEPTSHFFTVCVPSGLGKSDAYSLRKKGTQIPIVSDTSTTGHKLQGATVKELMALAWYYGQNWPSVVLSRVKTMGGLELREQLIEDPELYRCPTKLKALLQRFKEAKLVVELEDWAYAIMQSQTRTHSTNTNSDSN